MTDKLTDEEANKLIAEHLDAVQKHLSAAEAIATENGLSFRWDGPTYGMGGWYTSDEWQASSESY